MRKWLEYLYESWKEVEEAKEAYHKAMNDVVMAQKAYIANQERYNELKKLQLKERGNK